VERVIPAGIASHSAGHGIVRGWQGEAVDLTPTNTFEDIEWCKQGYPIPKDGSCPEQVPCDHEE
jgi:hypothetical protein